MGDMMTFPHTVEEFMERYKMVDSDHIYSNGIEYVPIFRMKQWFDHARSVLPERKTGRWRLTDELNYCCSCSECGLLVSQQFADAEYVNFCPNCGARMVEEENG